MLRALQEFVSRVHWLRSFQHSGRPYFDTADGLLEMKNMEKFVDQRTQKREARADTKRQKERTDLNKDEVAR